MSRIFSLYINRYINVRLHVVSKHLFCMHNTDSFPVHTVYEPIEDHETFFLFFFSEFRQPRKLYSFIIYRNSLSHKQHNNIDCCCPCILILILLSFIDGVPPIFYHLLIPFFIVFRYGIFFLFFFFPHTYPIN